MKLKSIMILAAKLAVFGVVCHMSKFLMDKFIYTFSDAVWSFFIGGGAYWFVVRKHNG